MRKICSLFILIVINANLQAQSLRKPIAASYIGLGEYSINHLDAFSFTSNQAALAQIKSPAIGIYGENRFLLNATNMYSAVAVMPTLL